MTTSALQQVVDALGTALAGISGVTIATSDPGGIVTYPALALSIGGQSREDESQDRDDWVLTVDVGIVVQQDSFAALNPAIATLFAQIGAAVEADRTLGGKAWDARVTGLEPVDLVPGDDRKPMAVSAATVEISYAQQPGDFYTLA